MSAHDLALFDRTGRYARRIDEWLAAHSRNEHLPFLRAELAKWTARYSTFQVEVQSGRPLNTTATAWDFAETISLLGAKIAVLEKPMVPA